MLARRLTFQTCYLLFNRVSGLRPGLKKIFEQLWSVSLHRRVLEMFTSKQAQLMQTNLPLATFPYESLNTFMVSFSAHSISFRQNRYTLWITKLEFVFHVRGKRDTINADQSPLLTFPYESLNTLMISFSAHSISVNFMPKI